MLGYFFKSKPSLNQILPENYVDIHSHLIPGVDDGAKNVENSIELIKEMKNLGFSKIITTPHIYPNLYENNRKILEERFKLINKKIKNVELNFAAEYMIDATNLSKIQNKNLLTLKDNYVLIEMSFFSEPKLLNEFIFELQNHGYQPVLAHPERYSFWFGDFSKFVELRKKDVKFQLNLLSVTDYYGVEVRKMSDKLLENNFIDFVGSDFHNLNQLKIFRNSFNDSKFFVKIKNIKKLENAMISNGFFRNN